MTNPIQEKSSSESQTSDPDKIEYATLSNWRALFAFTTRKHAAILACGGISAFLGGVLRPGAAIFIGYIFTAVTQYGAESLSGQETLNTVSKWCLALTALGGAAWLLEALLLSGWITFGELQARTAREKLFRDMLNKEMEWYDRRKDGLRPFLVRIQT